VNRSKLSIKNSTFSVITDGECDTLSDTSLEVVFVGANPDVSKMWYESEWSDDRDSTSPDCFSLDGKTPNKIVCHLRTISVHYVHVMHGVLG